VRLETFAQDLGWVLACEDDDVLGLTLDVRSGNGSGSPRVMRAAIAVQMYDLPTPSKP
jgi:hypothetical protein